MKLTLFLFAALITTDLFGQEDTPASDFKRVQIGINFSPDYCFRTLKNNDGSTTSADVITTRKDETPKLGYTTGINVIYNLKKQIGIEMGIQYSNKGYQTLMQNLTFGSMIDPRHGFVYSSSGQVPIQAKFIYNDYYLDLPLKANFTFGKKKIRFITSAGIITNLFLKETETSVVRYADGTSDRKTEQSAFTYNKVNISPMISAGIDWKLSSKSNLRIEPTFRYGVLKITNDPVTGYLWNAGLNISYYFGLK